MPMWAQFVILMALTALNLWLLNNKGKEEK